MKLWLKDGWFSPLADLYRLMRWIIQTFDEMVAGMEK
jgi:hypothetical protein